MIKTLSAPVSRLRRKAEAEGFGRLGAAPGFFVLLALACLFTGPETTIAFLAASLIHEASHAAAVRLLGGSISSLRFCLGGADMRCTLPPSAGYRGELAAVAAGPAANLVCGLLAAKLFAGSVYIYMFAGANLALGVFNLLPAEGLDGGRMLALLGEWHGGPDCGASLLKNVSLLCSGFIFISGIALFFVSGKNLSMLLVGMYLSFSMFYGIISETSTRHN